MSRHFGEDGVIHRGTQNLLRIDRQTLDQKRPESGHSRSGAAIQAT